MKPPCIRNLPRFKKGCPQKIWDGEEGCPCWIEMSVAKRENPKEKEIKKDCLDMWHFSFQWAMLGLLEGNQQATESFRNGMVETRDDGKDYPKPDIAVIKLFQMFENMQSDQRLIMEHETHKQLKG